MIGSQRKNDAKRSSLQVPAGSWVVTRAAIRVPRPRPRPASLRGQVVIIRCGQRRHRKLPRPAEIPTSSARRGALWPVESLQRARHTLVERPLLAASD